MKDGCGERPGRWLSPSDCSMAWGSPVHSPRWGCRPTRSLSRSLPSMWASSLVSSSLWAWCWPPGPRSSRCPCHGRRGARGSRPTRSDRLRPSGCSIGSEESSYEEAQQQHHGPRREHGAAGERGLLPIEGFPIVRAVLLHMFHIPSLDTYRDLVVNTTIVYFQ